MTDPRETLSVALTAARGRIVAHRERADHDRDPRMPGTLVHIDGVEDEVDGGMLDWMVVEALEGRLHLVPVDDFPIRRRGSDVPVTTVTGDSGGIGLPSLTARTPEAFWIEARALPAHRSAGYVASEHVDRVREVIAAERDRTTSRDDLDPDLVEWIARVEERASRLTNSDPEGRRGVRSHSRSGRPHWHLRASVIVAGIAAAAAFVLWSPTERPSDVRMKGDAWLSASAEIDPTLETTLRVDVEVAVPAEIRIYLITDAGALVRRASVDLPAGLHETFELDVVAVGSGPPPRVVVVARAGDSPIDEARVVDAVAASPAETIAPIGMAQLVWWARVAGRGPPAGR